MKFENPQILMLLLPVLPALVIFFWWSWRKRQQLMTQFVQARLLPSLSVGISPARQKIRFALLLGAVAALLFALARPQWGFSWEEVKQKGLDIVVAIDTSKSMLAEDIAPNRLARAKLAALDLIEQAKSDRLGLIAFAGLSYLQCPLTLDDVAFKQSLDALDVNVIPQGGTALAEAIEEATKAFREGDNYKILVMFTDGDDNDEGALEAATKAAQAGLRIFTVGIGTPEGELLRVTDAKGRSDYIRDENGAVVKSRLNETLLRQIAGAANGFYLPLRGAKTVETLYEKGIAPLPKSERSAKLARHYHEQFYWPLGLAILFLLVEMFLPERNRDQRINQSPASTATGLVAAVLFFGAFASITAAAPPAASPTSALREYNSGKYEEALKEYSRLLEKKPDDLRLHFNAGAAAYQTTNYDAALQYFNSALATRDMKLQQAAYFNLGNTHYRIGEMTTNGLNSVQQSWETAVKFYQTAALLDKNDGDAAYNLAFATSAVEQIKQLKEALRRAKGEADAAVRRAEYHRALEIMQGLHQNPLAKQFEEFTKKLKDIDDIANPPQP